MLVRRSLLETRRSLDQLARLVNRYERLLFFFSVTFEHFKMKIFLNIGNLLNSQIYERFVKVRIRNFEIQTRVLKTRPQGEMNFHFLLFARHSIASKRAEKKKKEMTISREKFHSAMESEHTWSKFIIRRNLVERNKTIATSLWNIKGTCVCSQRIWKTANSNPLANLSNYTSRRFQNAFLALEFRFSWQGWLVFSIWNKKRRRHSDVIASVAGVAAETGAILSLIARGRQHLSHRLLAAVTRAKHALLRDEHAWAEVTH